MEIENEGQEGQEPIESWEALAAEAAGQGQPQSVPTVEQPQGPKPSAEILRPMLDIPLVEAMTKLDPPLSTDEKDQFAAAGGALLDKYWPGGLERFDLFTKWKEEIGFAIVLWAIAQRRKKKPKPEGAEEPQANPTMQSGAEATA